MPDKPPAPLRFSLRTLFAITTLVAVVAACFVWNEFAGVWAYLGCLTLVLAVVRVRAARRRSDADRLSGAPPVPWLLLVLVSGGVALAGAVAFCATCSVVQVPFVRMVTADQMPDAAALFRRGLLVSIPLGTAALAFVYLLTWPPRFQRK